jgi:hypothetical protein
MTSMPSPAAARQRWRHLPVRSWRSAVGLAALAGGAAAIAGCLLPWATAFAGLVAIHGTRGSNGQLLAAAGVLIVGAGIWHLIRGGPASRWVIGVSGAATLGYSAYLLMRLASSLHSPAGDSMLLLRGGPGLWVVAAGGLAAFGTLFLPTSSQAAFQSRRQDGGGLLMWAADRESMGPRRWLQIALGVVWLLDAALQYQPYMFTKGFVTQIIEPAGMGSPALISNSVMGSGQIMLSHVAVFNALFATIQLLIGLGLLWRRTSRAALAGTIVWALGVWWLGEGLGGILTGSASPVTGAPGAALIYAIIAVLAWPPRPTAQAAGRGQQRTTSTGAGSIAAGSRIGLRGAQLIWAVLWVSFAYLILQAPNRAAGALHDTVAGLAGGEPGWIAAMDRGAAGAIGSGGTAISIALAVVFLIITAGVFVPATIRPALTLAVLAALAMWVAGQDLGGMLTGQGTDPGTGPLLILLAAAFWPQRQSSPAKRQPATAPTGTIGSGATTGRPGLVTAQGANAAPSVRASHSAS